MLGGSRSLVGARVRLMTPHHVPRHDDPDCALRVIAPNIEEREVRLRAMRDTLNASVAEGGHVTDGELGGALEAKAAELARAGY